MKHLQFIQSPSKDRLIIDSPLKIEQMESLASNKRGSLPSSNQNLFMTLDNASTRKLKLAKLNAVSKVNINQNSTEML